MCWRYLKKLLPVFLVMVCASNLRGQEGGDIDSLKFFARTNGEKLFNLGEILLEEATATNNNELRAQVLLEYANHNFYISNYNEADSLYSIVAEIGTGSIVITANIRKAFVLSERGEIIQADRDFQSQISICKANNDTTNWIEALNGVANIKTDQYKIDSAVYYYQVAMRLAEASNNDYKLAYLLNNIGLVKMDNDREEEALEDFLTALELIGADDDQRLGGNLANNIALIYMQRKEYEAAYEYFKIFLVTAREISSWQQVGVGLLNIGSVKTEMEEYDSAEFFIDSALYYLNATNSVMFLPKTLAGLAKVFTKTNRNEEALVLADSAVRLAIKYGVLEDQAFGHLIASQAFEALNMPDSALARYKEFKWMNDSIIELTNDKVLNELQVQYQVEKKDVELEKKRNEVALLEAERQLSQFRWRVGIGVGAGVLILSIVLLVLWRTRTLRRQQEKYSQQLLENVEAERSRIAQDLHDDIGQMLSSIKNRIHLQKEKSGSEEMSQLEDSLSEVIDKGRKISRSLYPSYLRRLGLTEALSGLLTQIEEDNNLLCTQELENIDKYLEPDQKLHIYRVIQECVSNTLKHAEAKSIRVDIKDLNGAIEIQYRDSGKGLGARTAMTGMGMMSISERVKLLGGDLEIGSNNGKGFNLRFRFNV